VIVDTELPAAAHLLGSSARHLVGCGVAALGGDLRRLRSAQVVYRPGSDLTVRYDALVSWNGAEPVAETLCAGTTRDGAPPGTVPLVGDGLEAGLWRYPFDPALPGLESSVTSAGVARLAGSIVGPHPSLSVRAYRPGRRAVVHAQGAEGEAYVKVVRPQAFDRLALMHDSLAPHLPVPDILVRDAEMGIVVLRALDGDGLRDHLRKSNSPLPSAETLLVLLDRLAAVPVPPGVEPVSSIYSSVAAHLTMIERTCPGELGRINALRKALIDDRRDDEDSEPVLIHGDLHDAQLLVAGEAVTGLLDIDGAGLGHRADDPARLLAHLSAMALGAGPRRRAIESYVESLRAGFITRIDPYELDLRVAAVVVGLATGPFRVQMKGWRGETVRRLELARDLARRARRASTTTGVLSS
jgi:hypothetical protein